MKKTIFIATILISTQLLTASSISTGKKLFKSKCISCHGYYGDRKALGISIVISKIGSAKKVKKLLTNMKSNSNSRKNIVMVNIASSLSKRDINNLSNYIATLKK